MYRARVLDLSARLEGQRRAAVRDEARRSLLGALLEPAEPRAHFSHNGDRAGRVRVENGSRTGGRRVQCDELQLGAEAWARRIGWRIEAIPAQIRLHAGRVDTVP